MPNNRIAELIATKLRDGLVHPGDGDQIPPTAIPLPMFRTAGMPKEYANLQNATAKTIGEAIVALIESDGASAIVGTAELEELRRQAAASDSIEPQRLSVHCRCDTGRTDPLLLLNIRGSSVVEIDGRQILKGLSKREIDCPHKSREFS